MSRAGRAARRALAPRHSRQGVADLDQTDPEAASNLGHWARRSFTVVNDRRAGPAFVGKFRDVVADVGGELPGAAVHGGHLHGLGLLIGRAG